MKRPIFALLVFVVSVSMAGAATTVFHFRVNDTDEAGLPTVPSVGGSAGTAQGVFSGLLSSDVPTVGVPAGAGNRSLVGAGAVDSEGVNSVSTQELSNAAVIAEGGFTMEAWFLWNGGGTVNSIIDYAGTEKFRIHTGIAGNLDMNFDSGSGPAILATAPTVGEWHYVAMVFEHDGDPEVGGQIGGTMTYYFDDDDPAGSVAVTKDDFGDSLNRPIGVGRHPLGFGGDHFDGLVYEPRVSLGALQASELLFQPQATNDPQISVAPSVSESSDGNPITITMIVRNLPGTTQELLLTQPTLSGADADDFSVSSFDTPIGSDGATGEIDVAFTPSSGDGLYEAVLAIPSNDSVNPSVTVALSVDVRDPVADVDTLLNLGAFPAGGGAQVANVGVRNGGGLTDLTVSNPQFRGPAAANFTASAIPGPIAPGASDVLEVTFTPSGGGLFIAEMVLETNDPRNPTIVVGLGAFVEGPIDLEGPSKLSHWTFDDADALGDDTGGLDYDGTVNGEVAASTLAAVGSGAAVLDGDFDYIEIPQGTFAYHQMADDGEGFSVAAWVCSSSEGDPNRQRYFSKFFDTGTSGFGVGQDQDTQLIGTTYGLFDYLGGSAPVQDEWHHVAYVFRGSPIDTLECYVDGALSATITGTTGIGAAAGTYAIGGLGGGAGEWFDGLLDDVRIYGVELSAANVGALAAMGTPGVKVEAGPDLQIVGIERNGNLLSITWTSREGAFYAASYSKNLEDWDGEFDDSIPGAAGASETSEVFDLALEGVAAEPMLYVRVSVTAP